MIGFDRPPPSRAHLAALGRRYDAARRGALAADKPAPGFEGAEYHARLRRAHLAALQAVYEAACHATALHLSGK